MALPVVNTPSTKVTLPSGKQARLSAFNGYVEKQLLLIKSEPDNGRKFDNVIDAISHCCDISVREMTQLDFEYTFMKLYELSISDKLQANVKCRHRDCDQTMQITVDLDKITVPERSASEFIDVKAGKSEQGNEVFIRYRQPTMQDLVDVTVEDSKSDGNVKFLYTILDGVFDGDDETTKNEISLDDFEEWILKQKGTYLGSVKAVYFDTQHLTLDIDMKCPNGHMNKLALSGFSDFFG